MKKNRLKIITFTLLLAVLSVLMCGLVLADEETEIYKISYYVNGSVAYTDEVEAGESTVLRQENDSTDGAFLGWSTIDGEFYAKGSGITPSKSVSLYASYGGGTAYTSSAFLSAVQAGNNYISLGASITLDNTVSLSDKIYFINTNGFTLTISGKYAFSGQNYGLVIMGAGAVNHTFDGVDTRYVEGGFASISPMHSQSNLIFSIGKGATVSSNAYLIESTRDLTMLEGGVSLSIYGEASAYAYIRSNGIRNARVTAYDASSVTMSAQHLFEDVKEEEYDGYLAYLTIEGGYHSYASITSFAEKSGNYRVVLHGGEYSTDISSFFSDANYVLLENEGTYFFEQCVHSGPFKNEMTLECEEPGDVTHVCKYCDLEYVVNYSEGPGHSYIYELEQDYIVTEETTEPGIYHKRCRRCGNTETEHFYPEPDKVWVSIYVDDGKGGEIEYRVRSSEIYEFVGTELLAFTLIGVLDDYDLLETDVVAVEVPLGTTVIHGDARTSNGKLIPSGAFYRNAYLKRVILPESIVNIEKYSFSDMARLETIEGIEYVTGTIYEHAFEQSTTHFGFDRLTINASVIEQYAFHNAHIRKTLTIGAGVTSIAQNAFLLDYESAIKEIFIEDYIPDTEGETLQTADGKIDTFGHNATGQQFTGKEIVFTSHNYTLDESIPPSCTEKGKNIYSCSRCALERVVVDESNEPEGHDFSEEWTVIIIPTCQEHGWEAHICTKCGEHDEETKRQSISNKDPNFVGIMGYHDFSHGTQEYCFRLNGEPGYKCESAWYTLGVCQCGAIDTEFQTTRIDYEPLSVGGFHAGREDKGILVEPTCVLPGEKLEECSICGRQWYSEVDPTGLHLYPGTGTVIRESTCVEQGLREFICTSCGDQVTGPIPINENAHLYGESVVVREPTETERGVSVKICERCERQISESIDMLGSDDKGLPPWAIALIVVGGVLFAGGIGLTLYFTLFKKKRPGSNYTFKSIQR